MSTEETVVILVVEQQPSSTIVVEQGTTVITQDPNGLSVLVAAEQGPEGKQGVAGPSGGAAFVRDAAATVSGGRAVALNADGEAIHADGADDDFAWRVVGLALNGANLGNPVTIATAGEVEEPTWSWIEGKPVFLGSAGSLTQTPPTSGFILVVGSAVGATRILVNVQQPIFI